MGCDYDSMMEEYCEKFSYDGHYVVRGGTCLVHFVFPEGVGVGNEFVDRWVNVVAG
jgi:hypothetical protein